MSASNTEFIDSKYIVIIYLWWIFVKQNIQDLHTAAIKRNLIQSDQTFVFGTMVCHGWYGRY